MKIFEYISSNKGESVKDLTKNFFWIKIRGQLENLKGKEVME